MARKRKVQNNFLGGNVDTSVQVSPIENPNLSEPTFGNINGTQQAPPQNGGFAPAPAEERIDPRSGPDPRQFIPDPEFDLRDQVQDLRTQGFFQGGDILGNLDPSLQTSIQRNISDLTTGAAGAAQRAAANEANIRQAANLRARSAGQTTLGQGAAIQAQQGTEQAILGGTSEAILRQNVADQKLRQQGTILGLNLAQNNEQSKQFAKNLELAFTGLAGDQQNLLTKLTVDQRNLLTKLDFDKAINSENLATQLKMLGMKITSEEQMEIDKNLLISKGMEFEKAKWEGYEDENGNWVMGTQQLEMIKNTALMNSMAGQSFASYVQGNLDADLSDPALRNLGNEMWRALGNEGDAPDWWLNARIEAVKDPRINNPIIGTATMLKEAVDAGIITQEQFDKFMEGMVNDLTGVDTGTTGDITGDTEIQDIETFDIFSARIPTTPEGGAVTQEDWESAGKPKTWEEFQNANILKGIESLIDSDGGVIKKPDLEKVMHAIDIGNNVAVNKYKANSEVESDLNEWFVNQPKLDKAESLALKNKLKAQEGKIINLNSPKLKGDFVLIAITNNKGLLGLKVMDINTRKISDGKLPIEWFD